MAGEREQTTIRIPAELKEQLQQEADKRGDSFNGFVVLIVNEGMKLIHQGQLWLARRTSEAMEKRGKYLL